MTAATTENTSAFDQDYHAYMSVDRLPSSTGDAVGGFKFDVKSMIEALLRGVPRNPIRSRNTATHSLDVVEDQRAPVLNSYTFDDESQFHDRFAVDSYLNRISALSSYAEKDGFSLNPESAYDFWHFVVYGPKMPVGDLVLIDNGNLRLVWKDGEGAHLGLQFLGGGTVQFVIFSRRKNSRFTSRVSGRDTFEGIERQIDAFELQSLLSK